MALAGCGDSKDFANDPRPPAPINISAAIDDERVSVDPRSFGAGPIVLRIANLTDETQRVTIETRDADSPGLRQTTSSINPQGTGTLKLEVARGAYTVSVADEDIRQATVRVGAERPSSQDELLQP